jgi:hypothetical protein
MTKQILLTRGLVALVDEEDYDYLMQWKWYASPDGRATRKIALGKVGKVGKFQRVFMHRLINKTPEGMHTDHINGDPLDNRKLNLRNCNPQQNARNRKSYIGSKSRFKGVSWHKRQKAWVAYICVNYKTSHLGTFKTEEDAAIAYNFAALDHFGEFAKLNSVGG